MNPNTPPEVPVALSSPGGSRAERGSALVLTMFVMVVLSALGLSFLVVSDTENQVAVNDRDARQVLYVAQAGAKLVEGWFNVPDAAYNPFVPDRTDCTLDQRIGDSDYDGTTDIDVPANGIGQRYRGGTATGVYRLFDKPFRGAPRDTFWGTRDNPDVLITNDPDEDDDYLSQVSGLFNLGSSPSLEGVEIQEIRVFAPPYDRQLQRRFGICTAQVTAAKVIVRGTERRRVAERSVTIVLQELPFPGPGAAIESESAVDVSGNFGVHWGGTFAEGGMSLQSGSNFPGPGVPRENTSRYRWADFSPNAPDLDTGTAGTQNLLTQLIANVDIADPWLLFRCNGTYVEAPNNDDQPWPYNYTVGVEDDKSIFYQNQTYTFPALDYEFWKRFTQLKPRNGSYYKFAGMDGADATFAKNGVGTAYKFAHWVNTENPGVKPGIFFFDTSNSMNPQDGNGGVLLPELDLNSSVVDSPSGDFIMEGMIYTNFALTNTSGFAGHAVTKRVNMPPEPFLDTGIDIDRSGVIGDNAEEGDTIGNGIWDFAFLGDTESQGTFYDDLYNTTDFNDFAGEEEWPENTLPHGGIDVRVLADVVHEPYLNFEYPEPNGPEDPLQVDFDFEATSANRRDMGGDRDGDGTTDQLTTLRDIKGAQVDLDLIVNGVWYNEGRYDGSGNLPVYGSILMRQGFEATGTPDVWFNHGLQTGDWPPPEMQIPRVYVSQMDTD